MTSLIPTSGPLGLAVKTETATLTCTDALVAGDLVTLTLADGGYTACTKSAAADSTPDHILGVATATVAAGGTGIITLKGVVQISRNDTGLAGLSMRVSGTAGRITSAPTTSAAGASAYIKVIGVALTAASVAGDLVSVLFNGVNGFAAAHS